MTDTATSYDAPVGEFAPASAAVRGGWWLVAMAGVGLLAVALWGVDRAVGYLAFGIEAIFVVYFLRHLSFTLAALRSATEDVEAPAVDSRHLPSVTVLVACKNEEAVVDGLLASLRRLDYPADRLELVVIDDGSSDGTAALLDAHAATWDRLLVLHRPDGAPGGKSGALNAGLTRARGEVIVVFDADHQPRPDVVWRLARHFADPSVGAVQGRCVIRNGDDSLLARLVAIDYLSGYLVNEYGRQAVFGLPAYGGANCAVRAERLRAIGCWNPASVTEDTDLTLRLALAGSRVRYDVTAVDEEEGVVTVRRFWRQRYRWALGHQKVCRDYRAAVVRSRRLTLAERFETLLFLFGFHVPVLCALSLGILVFWAFGVVHPTGLTELYVLWTLLFLGPFLEIAAGLLVARVDRSYVWSLAFFFPLYFVSIALCTKAWLDGLLGRDYRWVKTKRGADAVAAVVSA